MFELQRLLQGGGRELALQTRKTRQIANEVQCDPSPADVRAFNRLVQKHGWAVRKPPCGGYNCAGHVWAARRTAILSDADWDKIKEDDGYREFFDERECAIGDLVVYRDSQRRGYVHVAEIVELRPLAGSDFWVIWVISKLGACKGEVLHNCYNFPDRNHCEVTFWTDRP